MGRALMGGFLSKGVVSPDDLIACAPSESTRESIENDFGVRTYRTASEVCRLADIIVIAVKPYQVRQVFVEEKAKVDKGKTVVSLVAGLTLDGMEQYVPACKNFRVMPNHCVMVSDGAMGYCCSANVTQDDKKKIEEMLSAVGMVVEVPESSMDAITGLAGSSPAFMYMIIDAMADAGVLAGLPRKDAIELAAQSMLGAAKMVLETGKHPDVLKDEVCSPGGTTIEGVRTLEDMGLRSAVIAGVDAAVCKSREMSQKK
ncbi:MAG: pyrroline-5-carboxylate reductase [Candidatus Methanomethylophilaceae archaeon]|nr:pyrroline-5-carboxylate reductase [Candidatus Methanomethylophilaceae archaeon]